MKDSPDLLIYCTKDEISNLVHDAVMSAMTEQKPPKPETTLTRGKYLTRVEVCQDWKISLPTLHRLTKDGTVISYRIGGRVLFKNDELEKALTEVPNQKYRRFKK